VLPLLCAATATVATITPTKTDRREGGEKKVVLKKHNDAMGGVKVSKFVAIKRNTNTFTHKQP